MRAKLFWGTLTVYLTSISSKRPLQMEALGHEPLQAWFVENVVGELLVGKHGQGGPLGVGRQFRCLLHGEILVLADHRHHHVHHDLQAAQLASLFFLLAMLGSAIPALPCVPIAPWIPPAEPTALAVWSSRAGDFSLQFDVRGRPAVAQPYGGRTRIPKSPLLDLSGLGGIIHRNGEISAANQQYCKRR